MRTMISQRGLSAAALALLALAVPRDGRAQGLAVAGLRVAARVAPSCSVAADSSVTDAVTSPSVRVACGRSALGALRVSTDSNEDVTLVPRPAGPQQLSGGEVVFTVLSRLATLASQRSIASLPAGEPATVVVTLDF